MKELMEKSFDLFKRIPFIVIAVTIFGFSWWIFEAPLRTKGTPGYQNFAITQMTKVEATSTKGLVEIPLNLVKEKKLVSFDFQGIPLLAYFTPRGKVVTAVGFSDPCRSKSFHLERSEIVCNICFSRWNLDTLKGVLGECASHALEMVPHFVHEGRLILSALDLKNWKPLDILG